MSPFMQRIWPKKSILKLSSNQCYYDTELEDKTQFCYESNNKVIEDTQEKYKPVFN